MANEFMRGVTVVSTHSRPKAAGYIQALFDIINGVSTHSRPKAAGRHARKGFMARIVFQHTAARRRLADGIRVVVVEVEVSTHSRPKAAGFQALPASLPCRVSTHSRPKAAGSPKRLSGQVPNVSTHSRPKAAGSLSLGFANAVSRFQHTAARRRLEPLSKASLHQVSQPQFR